MQFKTKIFVVEICKLPISLTSAIRSTRLQNEMKLLSEYEIRNKQHEKTMEVYTQFCSVNIKSKKKNGTEWQTIQFPFFTFFECVKLLLYDEMYPSIYSNIVHAVDTWNRYAMKTSITKKAWKIHKQVECCNTKKTSLSNQTHSCNKNYYPLNGIRLR